MNYSWLSEKWNPRSLIWHISRVVWNHTKFGAQQGKWETMTATQLTQSIPKRAPLCLQWTLQPKGIKIIQQLLKINLPSGPCFLSCNSHQSRGVKLSLSHVSARVHKSTELQDHEKNMKAGCLSLPLFSSSMQRTLCSWKLKKNWDFSSLQVKCEQYCRPLIVHRWLELSLVKT